MGTPDFAVGVLDKLVSESYHVVGVVTVADKPAGRGKKLRASAVKNYALENKLPILQPIKLQDDDFLQRLEILKADLFIVVAFRMLPKVVWKIPKLGTFNLHASLLPAYRGAAPINWAIINGETETGVTTFFIDEKIDTGELILQKKVTIASCESAGSLHDKLMEKGGELVLETVNLIATANYKTKKQPEIAKIKAPKLFKENTRIDWNQPLKKIYNKIRGLSPFPVAWSKFEMNGDEQTIKFYHTIPEYTQHQFKIGSIHATNKTLKIAVKDGFLIIEELQLSGKRRMDTKSLLNGFQFSEGAQML
ncbi:MAG TPA: methionyl-tRNA formyltransferase [Lutibacter sp.]|nr:methionyl-tRNA formyltransferase [Lutibacter sp.]